jgi:hypothetical protein
MRTKLGLLALAMLAALAVSYFALAPAHVAFAEDGAFESAELAIASGDHTRLPYWLKNSIIVCAARTMDERVAAVKAALRQGYSLKEIGIRHGVRPEALEQGILRCERNFLHRLVDADKLARAEAARIYNFLEEHITRIINFHYQPDDPVVQDAASDESILY